MKVNLILSFVTKKMRSELQSANKFLPSTLIDLELKTCEYFTIIKIFFSITQYMYTIHSDWYGCLCFCALHVEETRVPGGNHGNLSDLVTTYRFICQRQGIKPSCERRAQTHCASPDIRKPIMHKLQSKCLQRIELSENFHLLLGENIT